MAENTESVLKSMENLLTSRLGEIEMWGDMRISDNDYESLAVNLNRAIYYEGQNGSKSVGRLCRNYPVCVTTFLVFLARKEYNSDFWGIVCKRLCIENKQANCQELGECARATFTKYGFDYSDIVSTHIYLDPILLQAGAPPISTLDQLFYILRYDAGIFFDPISVIEDLKESRSYAIRKPLLRFLRRFSDTRAIDFINEAYDAIRCVDLNAPVESQYVDKYIEWKENEKKKENIIARKKQENQVRPSLFFEDGKRGLCMILPRTIMMDDWLEEVKWKITTDSGFVVEKVMYVTGDEGSRYTESIMVPVCPAESYTVQLEDNEGLGDSKTDPYIIKGIAKDGYIIFNSKGKITNPQFFPSPSCVMVASNSVVIDETDNITEMLQSYPTDRADYKTLFFRSNGSGSLLRFTAGNKSVSLRAKPQISMELEGRTLFNLSADNRIFTDIPELTVTKDEGADAEGLILRINNSGKDIKLQNEFEGNTAVVKLPKTRFSEYGSYVLRLYIDDHFVNQTEFYYVPRIKTDYSGFVKWEDYFDRNKRHIKFDKKEGWELEFDNCVVFSDESGYMVECPKDSGLISGRIINTNEENGIRPDFKIPIFPFSAKVIDSQGQELDTIISKSAKIESTDILDEPKEYWINLETFGAFAGPDYGYQLQLVTANGEQTEQIKGMRGGCANFNLSAFYDTLRSSPLPAKIRLLCSKEEKPITLLTVKETVKLSVRPHYFDKGFIVLDIADDNKDLVLRKFGSEEAKKLPYSKARVDKSGKKLGYPCGILGDGLYTIDIENSYSGIFDFDDDNEVDLNGSQGVVYVRSHQSGEDIKDFSDWIERITYDILFKRFSNLVSDIDINDPYGLSKLERKGIAQKDCEPLIALASLADTEKHDKKRSFIKQIMKKISIAYLSSNDRALILKTALKFGISQSTFDICTEEYNFYLIKDVPDYKELSENVDVYSSELALLILLRNNDSIKNTIRKEKYREIIGSEAIRTMLHVPYLTEPSDIAGEQKKFLREQVTCEVEVRLTKEISGEMGPIQEMIVNETKNPYLDLRKKPDTGVYFNHIRYVDQYLNWFKQNYSKDMRMNESTRQKILNSQNLYMNDIVSCIGYFKKQIGFAADYDAVLKNRWNKDPLSDKKSTTPARFFYLLGVAALLVNLDSDDEKINDMILSAERFISSAISFCPKMARRDILMAATYIYLTRKEESLCQ